MTAGLPARFLAPTWLLKHRGYVGVAYFVLGTIANIATEDDWSPPNYYDEARHILLLTGTDCADDSFQQHCVDFPQVWMDRRTGAIFVESAFRSALREHKHAQIPAVFARTAAYGLGGGLLYAYLTAVRVRGDFWRRLRRGLGFAAALIAAVLLLQI